MHIAQRPVQLRGVTFLQFFSFINFACFYINGIEQSNSIFNLFYFFNKRYNKIITLSVSLAHQAK